MYERVLRVPEVTERENLTTFLGRVIRLDEAAIVRLRQRSDGLLSAWAATGFDVLAVRVVAGTINPNDTSAGADDLLRGLQSTAGAEIDPGFSMDSAWRGALPPEQGFTHVDDVPARTLIDLAQRGAALAKEHGSSHGPPVSLLDQEVVHVESGALSIGVPMRCVFALTAMGFIPSAGDDPMTGEFDLARIDAAEVVRVRSGRSWLRIDARYGSVYQNRGGNIPLMVSR